MAVAKGGIGKVAAGGGGADIRIEQDIKHRPVFPHELHSNAPVRPGSLEKGKHVLHDTHARFFRQKVGNPPAQDFILLVPQGLQSAAVDLDDLEIPIDSVHHDPSAVKQDVELIAGKRECTLGMRLYERIRLARDSTSPSAISARAPLKDLLVINTADFGLLPPQRWIAPSPRAEWLLQRPLRHREST